MAGPSLGAPAPASSLTPVVTRTRREFGGLLMNSGQTLTVAASRRASECKGVQVSIGQPAGDTLLQALLEPAEARILARALIEAAAAVDQAQRHPQFARAEVRHG